MCCVYFSLLNAREFYNVRLTFVGENALPSPHCLYPRYSSKPGFIICTARNVHVSILYFLSRILRAWKISVRLGSTVFNNPHIEGASGCYLAFLGSGEKSKPNADVLVANKTIPLVLLGSPRYTSESGLVSSEFSESSWFHIEDVDTGVVLDREVERPIISKFLNNKYVSLVCRFFFGCKGTDVFISAIHGTGSLPEACRGFTDSTVFGCSTGGAITYFLLLIIGEIFRSLFLPYRQVFAMLGSFFPTFESRTLSCLQFYHAGGALWHFLT